MKKSSEREQRQEIYRVRDILREKPYVVDDYVSEMRLDRAGNFFFFIKKDGKVIYISDKFEDENKAVKKLLEAI